MKNKTKIFGRIISVTILAGILATPFLAYFSQKYEQQVNKTINTERKVKIQTVKKKNVSHSPPSPTATNKEDLPASALFKEENINSKKTVTQKPNEQYEGEKKTQKTKNSSQFKTSKPTETPKKNYSKNDLYLLSHLLYGEAGNTNWEEMVKVGSVALNRVNHSAYPDTLYKVIYQKGQYACTWDGNFNKEPSELAIKVAEHLLKNGSQIPKEVVYQADFKQGSGVWTKTKWHYYCYY